MSKIRFNIAVDGPAGAGKSTVAKRVAKDLNMIYVDTGAMYRALGLYLLENGIAKENEEKITSVCKDIEVTIIYEDGEQRVILNGKDVSHAIRAEEVGVMASVTSAYQSVRAHLLSLQKKLANDFDVIMDGRDIGTCILPNADLKVYLTASSLIRAKRRVNQLKESGVEADIETVEKDIIERDQRDMNREIAPLKQADDAYYLDSSEMSMEQVVSEIVKLSYQRGYQVESGV